MYTSLTICTLAAEAMQSEITNEEATHTRYCTASARTGALTDYSQHKVELQHTSEVA